MTGEVGTENEVEEVTGEVSDAEEASAFAGEFGAAPAEEAETEPEESEEEAAAPPEDEAAADEAPDDTDELQKLLDDLGRLNTSSAMTDKQIRQIHGKFGEIQQAINELKAAGSGGNVRVSKDQFKKLGEDYPELAEMLAEDLAGISIQGGFSPEQMQPLVNAEVAKVREEMNQKMQQGLLTVMHPDWMTVRDTEPFQKWKAGLTNEERNEFDNSWDAMTVGGYLARFKSWREESTNVAESRKDRLKRAVAPRGVGAVNRGPVTEEDAFNAEFKT